MFIAFTTTVSCEATDAGTSAGWELKGMSGWTGLPQQIPPGETRAIPHDGVPGQGSACPDVRFAPGGAQTREGGQAEA